MKNSRNCVLEFIISAVLLLGILAHVWNDQGVGGWMLGGLS